MLTKYIEAAMRHAEYEIIEEDNSFYDHIPELEGLWANAATLEVSLLFGLAWKDEIAVVDGIDITIHVKSPM